MTVKHPWRRYRLILSDHAGIIKSIAALFISQGGLYVVPLITVPYLTRVLGVEQYGVLGMATNIVGYLTLVIDWGFSFSATQQAARTADDPIMLRRIFWDTITAKTVLAVICLIAFLAMIALVPQLRHFEDVLALSLLPIVASVFSVDWFLQGIERFVGFATAMLIGRLGSVPLLLAFVHSPSDTKIATLIQGASFFVPAVASVVLARRAVPLAPVRIRLSGGFHQISSGGHLFLSKAAIGLYTQSNLVVLGLMAGPTQAGLFFGADRLRLAVQGLISPVSTAFYPRINNLMSQSPAKAVRLMLVLLACQGGFTFFTSLALFLTAKPLTLLLLGHGFEKAILVCRWLAALPFLVGLSNVLAVQMMLPMGMKWEVSRIVILAGTINMVLLFPLTHFFGAVGAAAAVVTTETVVTLLMGATVCSHRQSFKAISRMSAT
jgi:polysaccharide transporter, PST family